MLRTHLVLLVCLALMLSAPAVGFWTDEHKMHDPQVADYASDTGMAVRAEGPIRLADDFECTGSGPITEIHTDVSWWQDSDNIAPLTGAHLAIRGAGSEPGDILWSMSFSAEEVETDTWMLNEDGLGWYDPATGVYDSDSHWGVHRLSFHIDPDKAFDQTAGENYWLEVSLELDGDGQIGWCNTSDTRDEANNVWGNGAVWWDDEAEQWRRLEYPTGHDWADDEMDLAFIIVPEPATLTLLAAGAVAALMRRRR